MTADLLCSPCQSRACHLCQQGCAEGTCPQHPEDRLRQQRGAAEFATLTAETRTAAAARSLSRFLGVTETRALDLLGDHDAYAAEFRSRAAVSGAEARRRLEEKFRPSWMTPA